MDDYKNAAVSSLDAYRKYQATRGFFNLKYSSKQFFVQLREIMITELNTQGKCALIDEVIAQRIEHPAAVAYAAVLDVEKHFKTRMVTDVDNDPKYRDFIPYVNCGDNSDNKDILWSQADRKFYTITANVADRFQEVMTVCRKAQKKDRKPNEGAERPVEKNDNQNSEAEKQVELILVQAESKAEEITEEASVQAERILEEARKEAQRIKDDAQKQAEISARQMAKNLSLRYLADEQRAYKTELNDEMKKFTDSYIENSNRAMAVHSQMCDATNTLQANWIRTLDEFTSRITDMKSELYSYLHNWQVSLFPKELEPLAERYLELYRILNVDKLIREEINQMSCVKMEENRETADTSETRIAGLQRLNKTLNTFLRRFEISLNGFDLYVYYPHSGELFDSVWHIPDDEDEDCSGRRITECIVPGIAKKANDSYGDDVLIPAVVKVEDVSSL